MRCVIRVWEMMKRGSVDQLRSLEENERKCEVCVCVCEGQTDGEREGDEMGFACQSGDGN